MSPGSPAAFALVALGGAVGAALRHGAATWMPHADWPRATFLVNVTGCLALGLLVGASPARTAGDPEPWRLLVVTGVLGGYTTFSAFGGETASLLRDRPAVALAYAAASLLAGVGAVLLGRALTR